MMAETTRRFGGGKVAGLIVCGAATWVLRFLTKCWRIRQGGVAVLRSLRDRGCGRGGAGRGPGVSLRSTPG
jgi:hypothetical protein